MDRDTTISPSVIQRDGKTFRLWWQPAVGQIGCANPACQKVVARTEAEAQQVMYLYWPHADDPDVIDTFYFCGWNCLATWARMNDHALVMATEAEQPLPQSGGNGSPQPPKSPG